MEIDGMYENTPWERLSLVAPWVGLGALLVALILLFMVRGRTDINAIGIRRIGWWLAPAGASLLKLGALFAIFWRPAHDTYPHAFGRMALLTGGGALIIGIVLALFKLIPWRAAILYGGATAASCAAAAISAFSHSIIAEGQVTAMVVPVGFVFALVLAIIISAVRYRDPIPRATILGITFLILAIFIAYKLPVVQFRDGGASSEIYPVTGSLYALLAGVFAGIVSRVGPTWWLAPAAILAAAAGYVTQVEFGVAIAALGLAIAIGIGEPTFIVPDENPPSTRM